MMLDWLCLVRSKSTWSRIDPSKPGFSDDRHCLSFSRRASACLAHEPSLVGDQYLFSNEEAVSDLMPSPQPLKPTACNALRDVF